MRARKVSDIHHRVDIVNSTGGAVLLSIHQNSLPSSRVTHGAQVFWNTGEGAEALAQATRSEVVQVIGTKFVLYRETHSKEKDKRIKLVK